MKYAKVLEKISAGKMNRSDLQDLRKNALDKHRNGDVDAMKVITAIDIAKPIDTYILFMGFCPDANVNERLDIEWKEKGICRFDYPESLVQVERFNSICVGDLVILKKIAKFGKTMTLHGHGRVKEIAYDENNVRFFMMDWSNQSDVIEVPLMGAGSTVNIKAMESVEGEMPDEFYAWLGSQ
jgi:hypothetical protein